LTKLHKYNDLSTKNKIPESFFAPLKDYFKASSKIKVYKLILLLQPLYKKWGEMVVVFI